MKFAPPQLLEMQVYVLAIVMPFATILLCGTREIWKHSRSTMMCIWIGASEAETGDQNSGAPEPDGVGRERAQQERELESRMEGCEFQPT